jgi:hypothetical protein
VRFELRIPAQISVPEYLRAIPGTRLVTLDDGRLAIASPFLYGRTIVRVLEAPHPDFDRTREILERSEIPFVDLTAGAISGLWILDSKLDAYEGELRN